MIVSKAIILTLLLTAQTPDRLEGARGLIAAGRIDSAIASFEALYGAYGNVDEVRSGYLHALRLRAASRFRAGDYRGAEKDLARAEQLAPEDEAIRRDLATVLFVVGTTELASGDTPAAENYFLAAEKLDRERPEFRRMLAQLDFNRGEDASANGRYPEAIAHLRRALAHDSTLISAHLRIGEIYYMREEYDLARHHLKIARELTGAHIQGLDELLARAEREFEATRAHQTLDVGGFLVRFEGGDRFDLIYEALPVLQDARARAARVLEKNPVRPLTIVLYSGTGIARAVDLPDWAVGLYDGKIRFRDLEIVGDPERFRRVARHEIGHAVMEEVAPGVLPPWVHEGIARYLEIERWDKLQDASYLVAAIKNRRSIPLAELATPFNRLPAGTDIRLAYAESAAMIRHLGLVYGDAAIADLVAQLSAGKSVEAAVDAVTFQDLSTFQQRVHDWVIWEFDK